VFGPEQKRTHVRREAPRRPPAARPDRDAAQEPLLLRLDRVLGRAKGQYPPTAAMNAGSWALAGPGELEDQFAFWAVTDAAGPQIDAEPNYVGLGLSAVLVCAVSATAISMVTPYHPSVSQITDYFATSVPGYDQDQGIPVLQRSQPLFENSGLRAGSFVVRPTIETGVSYDDNVLGGRGSPSSVISRTSPSVAINSDWSRNAVGAYLSAETAQYLNTPNQSRTDWTGAIGGTYTIGRGDLTFAYSHLALHQDSTYLNAVPTSTPLPFTVEDLRATYAIKLGSLTLTPNVDVSVWRFGTATVGGQSINEAFQDRDVFQGGLAAAYELSSRASLLGTVSVIDSHYVHPQPGVPGPSAVSTLGMGGIDYRFNGALRMRVLLGAESRDFQSAAYRSRIAPVGQANVIWTPSGLTTVTATVARTLEDAVEATSGGYTYTRADLNLDHELFRNVVLTSHIGVQDSKSLQQNTSQTTFYGGFGATWKIDRNLSLIMSYQYTSQSGLSAAGQPALSPTTTFGAYSRNVVDVRLRAAL
jgi:hypothetical protein